MASISLGTNNVSVGLDIGTDHVRVAQLKQTAGTFNVVKYGVARIPMGSVIEGEIVEVDAVASAIKEVMRTTGLRTANAAIGVSNQKVVVRLIDLPYMERAELEGAIQYQAQDYIPIPVEDAIIDFQIIGDYTTNADEHMMEVLLVAAQRDMIGNAVAAVEQAGLKLQQIDVTSFAIVRGLLGTAQSVLPEEVGPGEAVGIVHVSAGITNIAVVEKGAPRFTRVSALAGNEFTRAIANSLNLSFDEAEDLKRTVGLPGMEQSGGSAELPAGVEPRLAQEGQDALEREVSRFIAEIRRSLDYYLTQASQARTIRQILLTGSGAQLRNLDSYLEHGLQTKVEIVDPLRWLHVPPQYAELLTGDRMGSVAAIGLAMGSVTP